MANTLSQAPARRPTEADQDLMKEMDFYVSTVVHNLPISEQRLEKLRLQQEEDEVCKEVASYCRSEWPERRNLSKEAQQYHQVASELSIAEGLLMRQNRIIIPSGQRPGILEQIHKGHQGIVKCRERAASSVWWPGLSRDIEKLVNNCTECRKLRTQIIK